MTNKPLSRFPVPKLEDMPEILLELASVEMHGIQSSGNCIRNVTAGANPMEIKLGIDAHAKWYYVARQLDGATPQPVQKMDLDGLLHFVAKQQRLAQSARRVCAAASVR